MRSVAFKYSKQMVSLFSFCGGLFMHARHLLLNRSSMPRLQAPAPTPADIELMKAAALRVPDHMSLVPYEFLLFEGEARVWLGDVFRAAATQENLGEQAVTRAPQLPLRAPLVMVVVTKYQEHPSVPFKEQFASAACAAFAVEQMAFTQGYGAVWRTGPYAESDTVKDALKVSKQNDILGFLYIGTPPVDVPIKPAKDADIFRQIQA